MIENKQRKREKRQETKFVENLISLSKNQPRSMLFDLYLVSVLKPSGVGCMILVSFVLSLIRIKCHGFRPRKLNSRNKLIFNIFNLNLILLLYNRLILYTQYFVKSC